MNLLVLLTVAVASAQAVSFSQLVMSEWEQWKVTHEKTYQSPLEEKFRLKVYMENRAKIAKHNRLAELGKHGYTLKMNHFGDLLGHEFTSTRNGYKQELRGKDGLKGARFIAPENVVLPKSVDWRTKGAVTPIKDQGECGSCWAFSATGALEAAHFRATGKLVSLSEQQLVDCSSSFGNSGCGGGIMDMAFKYIKAVGGIDTEKSYPYDAKDESCHFNQATIGATDNGYVHLQDYNETALEIAVATMGPVSVAIDASFESFQFYHKGIYWNPQCSMYQLDHGVLVVGYGEEEGTGEKYWIVKNSWGIKWGDEGYIKMTKGEGNMCGIASEASYPLA